VSAVHAGFGDRVHIEPSLGLARLPHVRESLANLTLHRCGNIVDRIANGGDCLRIGCLESRVHRRRG
jgi:hypothetical protein